MQRIARSFLEYTMASSLSWMEDSNRQYLRCHISATHITNENQNAKDIRNAKKSTITTKYNPRKN